MGILELCSTRDEGKVGPMARTVEALAEGTIDLFDTATWTCDEHRVAVKVGQECLFCMVDLHGPSVIENYC